MKEKMPLEEERKSTSLAKFLRILRIKNDELLGDMAQKLSIKPSYLSSIEANRRPLTQALKEKLVESYRLEAPAQAELENCIAEAARSVEVNLSHVRDEKLLSKYVDTALLFAKDLSTLSSTELDEIQELLARFNNGEKRNEKRNCSKSKTTSTQRV